jgi:hypothetical protein
VAVQLASSQLRCAAIATLSRPPFAIAAGFSPFAPQTRLGNPCIAAEVDRYISTLDNERADAGSAMGALTRQAVSPSQLHLLLSAAMDEFRRLVTVAPLAAFRALRDALFFSLSWATTRMDRVCDLLELHLSQIVASVSPSHPVDDPQGSLEDGAFCH